LAILKSRYQAGFVLQDAGSITFILADFGETPVSIFAISIWEKPFGDQPAENGGIWR
jgi:hypothetical protein